MGSPQYPTQAQIEQLNRESALAAPELLTLRYGAMELDIPVNALILLELRKW
jgi:xylan 1,4-beta-xylosidase